MGWPGQQRGQRLFARFLIVSAFVCLLAAPRPAFALASSTVKQVRVSYVLRVSRDQDAAFSTVVTASMAATNPDFTLFRSSPPGSADYVASLSRLISGYGAASAFGVQDLLSEATAPLAVDISNGRATLTVATASPEIWQVDATRTHFDFSIPAMAVPENAQIDAALELERSQVRYAKPSPSVELGAGKLGWSFFPGERTAGISVRVTPGLRGAGAPLPTLLQQLAQVVLGWLATLVLLVGATHLFKKLTVDATGVQGRRARELAWLGIALTSAIIIAITASDVFYYEADHHVQAASGWILAGSLATTLVPLSGILALWGLSTRAQDDAKLSRARLALFLAATGTLVVASITQQDFEFGRPGHGHAWLLILAIACAAVVGLVAYLIIEALAHWFQGAAPELVKPVIKLGPQDKAWSWTHRAHVGAALLVVALWLLDTYRQGFRPDRQPWQFRIVRNATFVATNVLSITIFAVSLLVAIALLVAIWQQREATPGAPRRVPESWGVATLLFAGFVVGNGGVIKGYRAPIAFGFALAIGAAVFWRMTRVTDDHPRLSASQNRELLQASTRLEAIGRRQRTLYDDYMAGKIPDDDYFAQQDALQQRRNESRAGSVSPTEARRLALSLGADNEWWQNVKRACRFGSVLALAPLSYTLYVLLTTDVPNDVKARETLYFTNVLITFADQAFLWLFVAALFGALYPYLPGAAAAPKAAALTLLYILPNALASLLVDPTKGTSWIFTAAELGLFLLALGVLLDLSTLRSGNVYWRHVLDLYRVQGVRTAIIYGAPVLLLLATVAQQLASGNARQAIGEIAKQAPAIARGGG